MGNVLAFYSFAIVAIFWESFVLFHPQTVSSFIKFLPEKVKDYTKTQLTYGIIREIYFVWTLIGFWSSQRQLFSLLLILAIFNLRKSLFGLIVNALLTIFILLIIIINRFDWNVDIMLYIRQHFNH